MQFDIGQRALTGRPHLTQQPLKARQIAVIAQISDVSHPALGVTPIHSGPQCDLRPETTEGGIQLPKRQPLLQQLAGNVRLGIDAARRAQRRFFGLPETTLLASLQPLPPPRSRRMGLAAMREIVGWAA